VFVQQLEITTRRHFCVHMALLLQAVGPREWKAKLKGSRCQETDLKLGSTVSSLMQTLRVAL
jgi:hypothetical protein